MTLNSRVTNNTLIVEPDATRLDVQSVPDFKSSVTGELSGGQNLIVDLHLVQFIDSTGLGALLSLLRLVKETDGQMLLANLSDQALAMFRLVKMTRIFDIYPTAELALDALDG